MGRGRKPISTFQGSDWETVFYNSVGSYVQYINIELSKEYKLEPLSNHIKIVGGYAFKTAQYRKQGVPIIRISDFNNEQIILKDVVFYESTPSLEKFELIEGDIIIALTGGTIAKLAIVQPDLGKIYLNQRVGKFEVLHPEIFEREYIYWIARSVQSIIKNLAWGAAIPNVSPKQIEELKFPFPTKEVQKGIIAFLNNLKKNTIDEDKVYFNESIENEIILLQEKQITTSLLATELNNQLDIIKQLRQAFLNEAIRGELIESSELQTENAETGQQLLDRIKAEKAQLITDKILKKEKELPPISEDEIPFEIPENWVWCRLGDVIDLTSGQDLPPNLYSDINSSGLPYITGASNLQNGEVIISRWTETPKSLAVNGDLLLTCKGSGIGKMAYLKIEKAHIARQIMSIRSPFILIEYIELILLNNVEEFRLNAKSLIPGIDRPQVLKLLLPLPPLNEQVQIVLKSEELKALCENLENNIKVSQSYNEKLLKQALNDALGLKSTEEKETTKDTKRAIKKFHTDSSGTFTTLSMKIIDILKTTNEPIPANVVWNSSEYRDDVELFYAELKKLIDIDKVVIEEKIGMESYLKLASNEN